MSETIRRNSGETNSSLEEYRRKRAADRTPEPFGIAGRLSRSGGGMFVVQKHAARRLHYDFRLEMEGVLRSWAVPKGPSLDPADKRLAVMVEDHPLEYADFEGLIPAGNYGAGAVIVWDRGEYRAIDPPSDAAGGIRAGKLDIEMRGFKLQGAYTMVRTSGRDPRAHDKKPQWLLIKKRDEFVSAGDLLERRPRSVLSGLSIEEMREGDRRAEEISAALERLRAPALRAPIASGSFAFALARLVREPVEGDDWLHEIKFDGVRALALRDGTSVRIIGRSGIEVTTNYPEVALALSKLPFTRFAFDGEIVAPALDGRPNFQLLQRRIQAHDPDAIARLALAAPAYYQVFDLLAFDKFDVRPLDLETRKSLLRRMLYDEGPLRYVDHHVGDGRAFLEAVAQNHLEGAVSKLRRAPYPVGRNGAWVKIKCPTTTRCVIGGWTDPAGSRSHFGALLLGQYEAPGVLRFVGRVGTGFDEDALRSIAAKLRERARVASPFRRVETGEAAPPPRGSHFCEPALVCEVRFSEWTDDGVLRHPSFLGLIDNVDPAECIYEGASAAATEHLSGDGDAGPVGHESLNDGAQGSRGGPARNSKPAPDTGMERRVAITHADKVFWPAEGYTKSDLVTYYQAIAPWILPYLKDRPVVLTRYPDGIDGKSFFQKDAPAYVPSWIRRTRVYSEDSKREIAFFIIDSAEALAYVANMASIPIHIWSSRVPNLDSPDWLLFDIDPKGSTTEKAVIVAQEVGAVLRSAGMRPYVKTSGQKGIHVVVGLVPRYTYEQARMFSELVARVVIARRPAEATLLRNPASRGGRVYIDYIQLGEGKTIAAPFSVRPQPGAPVSAPLEWRELQVRLDPVKFNIKTMPQRMARLGKDPFIGALEDRQEIESALARLESMLDE
jgi:bifunctional non-homologous end joining protein LigD